MQSKLCSLVEVLLNLLIGMVISFAANLVIMPAFGHGVPTFLNNLGMTVVFTLLSLVRSYALRRWFNAKLHKALLSKFN